MKKIQLIIIFSISIIFGNAQTVLNSKKINYDKHINPNILRISLTEPLAKDYETNSIVGFNYEQKIKNAFTVVGKIGCGVSIKNFGGGNQKGQYSFHAVGAVELRYYFTLYRRIRKEKYVKNYTAPYVSLEQNVFSNAITLINQNSKDAVQGSTNSFLNLGYQLQSGKLYLAAFFGVRLGGKGFSKYSDDGTSAIHGGAAIGYVF